MMIMINVISDIIHLIKMLFLCDVFFVFKKRTHKHANMVYVVVAIVMGIISAWIYLFENDLVETVVYIVVIINILCILYDGKILKIAISAIWMIFALSMIYIMSDVLFDIVMNLTNMSNINVSKIGATFISFIFVLGIGEIYRRKCVTSSITTIGISNLIMFGMLAIVDTFIVVVMSNIIKEGIPERYKTLCYIAFILVILGIFLQLGAVILLFMQRNVYKEKKQITEKYLNEQKNHYEYLDKREKETKKFRHDLRNHMQMLSSFARNHQYDEFDKYLETIEMKIESFGNLVTVHNGIVDAVINQFYSKAIQNNIKMEVRGRFPEDCAIDAYDLCTIFSNVLSNALEAAIETDEKLVTVECRYTDKNIIVVVTNSFTNDGNETIKTRKDDLDYHGYGLENTKDSVEKYHGVFDIETKDNLFILKILFNYIEKRDYENRNN